MPKHSPTRLACVVAAALGAIASASSASAVTPLTSCATLDTFGGSYIVRANLVSCGPCFVIANDRITLDLGAHAVSGECPLFGAGITDDGEPRRFTTVKNGAITGFSFGVNLGASSRSEIRNVQSSANGSGGMLLGARSLVRGCVVADNGGAGITIGAGSQVQGCLVVRNGGIGIFGATQMLITQNTITNNATGIVVGEIQPDPGPAEPASTVSFNTVSENDFFGILGGQHVHVTGNTTDDNGAYGIAFGAFSTISFNVSRGNGVNGVDGGLEGLFDATHSTITGNLTTDNGRAGIFAECPSVVANNRSAGNGFDVVLNGAGCQATNNN